MAAAGQSSSAIGGYGVVGVAALIALLAMAVGFVVVPSNRQAADALELSFPGEALGFRILATEDHPEIPELLLPLAEAYVTIGDQETALGILNEYLDKRPGDLAALRRASTLADWQLLPDQSAFYRQKIRAADPGDVEAREKLGDYLVWRQRLPEAAEVYRELFELSSGNLPLQLRVGDALSWIDLYQDAINIFQRASLDHPDSIEPLLRLGRMHRWSGDDQPAIRAYVRATEVDADSLLAWQQLVELYRITVQLDERAQAQAEVRRLQSSQ